MKKNKRNNSILNHIIYPKELSGYILITLILLVIFLTSLYLVLTTILSLTVSRNEIFVYIIFILIIFLPVFYFALNLYMLLTKKIYIETTEFYLKIKKTFRTHIVEVSEIESMEKNEYRNPFTKIIIKTKPNVHEKDNIKIKFPVIWFSDNDLNNLISYLRKRNKSIYYKTYRVYSVKRTP